MPVSKIHFSVIESMECRRADVRGEGAKSRSFPGRIRHGGLSSMRNWSIYAGRLLGVELRVHLTFLFLLLFVLLNDSSGGAGMARGLALVALIFASVTIHEMGHLVVAARQGMRVRAIL